MQPKGRLLFALQHNFWIYEGMDWVNSVERRRLKSHATRIISSGCIGKLNRVIYGIIAKKEYEYELAL
jgi:hypothetical protein